jgi:quinol monooxygenase YgiN
MTSKPLTLHITWHFPPEQVPTFYEVLRPLHERIKEEKECLYFNVYEIAQQPGVVRLVEIWDCDMKWMVEVSSLCNFKNEYKC